MSRKVVYFFLVFLLLFLLIIFSRQDPESYIFKSFPQTDSDWGNLKVLKIEELNGYTAVHVRYQAKKFFQTPERWFIKERREIKELPGGIITEWEGIIYLVRDKLIFWDVIY